MEEELRAEHRSGFVALAGRPNVGKSTLLNQLVGMSVAAVSPRPQTTRRNQLGILTTPTAQIIFVDTPGVHTPRHHLGSAMVASIAEALASADLVLAVFDLTSPAGEEDRAVAARLGAFPRDRIAAVLNKADVLPVSRVSFVAKAYADLLPGTGALVISALRGDGCARLLEWILDRLPPGPPLYPPDQATDRWERDLAADRIQAAALRMLRHEVPHALGVRIDEYRERGQTGAYIAATLWVERESQKGIVIGRGGRMLREIGRAARAEVEELTGRKVYLDLRVKVRPGWRDDPQAVRELGYSPGGGLRYPV